MLYDPMLQEYLRGPLLINRGELLLAMDTVATDAENLAESGPVLQVGELRCPVQVVGG